MQTHEFGMFDWARPAIAETVEFQIVPRYGGGWDAVSAALAVLLEKASVEGLWWATVDLGEAGRIGAFAHLGPGIENHLWTEVSARRPPAGRRMVDPCSGRRTARSGLGRPDRRGGHAQLQPIVASCEPRWLNAAAPAHPARFSIDWPSCCPSGSIRSGATGPRMSARSTG